MIFRDAERHLVALVLAAGASTRLGQPKQLVVLHGETLVARAVRLAREAGARTVFVVVGAEFQPIVDVVSALHPPARVLLNRRWQMGMSTSLALGAHAAEREGANDLLVLACDQISVTVDHLLALREASHREHVAASYYADRRGVPAFFPEFSFHALQQLTGDRGARDLLAHADVLAIPLEGGDFDIDTPEDLHRLQAMQVSAHTEENRPMYDRARAWTLLTEWTTSPSLLKHALAVETCTAAYGEREAARLGLSGEAAESFIEPYRIAGLLHDFDYDRHPSLDEHVWVGNKVLMEQGWPEPIRHAILAHAEYTQTPRESHLDRALFASDELSGFLTACALVKPTKSIHDVEVPGVRKKMKDKAFARGVLREDIVTGAELLGITVDDHIANCLTAMQQNAGALGLDGVDVQAVSGQPSTVQKSL